jgi:hypothetical protein
MRELAPFLTVAGALAYIAIGVDLLHAVGKQGTGFAWDEPPTPFRKAVVVLCWPVVLFELRRS